MKQSKVSLSSNAFSSVALCAAMALGTNASASAAPSQFEFESVSSQQVTSTQGTDGVGLGGVVMPTPNELGALNINLYDSNNKALYSVTGSMSLYLTSSYFAPSRDRFGGFEGSLREIQRDGDTQDPIQARMRGTWSLDGRGQGVLTAVAFQTDGSGATRVLGRIQGEFKASEVSMPDVQPLYPELSNLSFYWEQRIQEARKQEAGSSEPTLHEDTMRIQEARKQALRVSEEPAFGSLGRIQEARKQSQACGVLAFGSLKRVQEARKQAQDSGDWSQVAQDIRMKNQEAGFAERSAELEERIRAARKQAQADGYSISNEQLGIPVQAHPGGKIQVSYKLVD
jgi:hypothetical protein